jgi:hypothetical protein
MASAGEPFRFGSWLKPAALTLVAGWTSLAVLALLVWLLPQLPEPLWPVPLIVAAAPLAWHLVEWRLAKRRALLAGLTRADGQVRAWLWKGRLLQIGAALAAVAMLTILYLSASFLAWQHWAALAGYVVLLAVAAGPVRHALSSEVDRAHVGMIVRHGPLAWAGALLVAAAFLVLGFVLDEPDLRGEPFAIVLESAYWEGVQGAEAASLQLLLGAANAVRMGVWYWAQSVGSQLDTAAAWMFWLAFLLGVGGIASLVNAYVLAAIGVAERALSASLPQAGSFRLGFVATLAAIGIVYVAASSSVPRVPLDRVELPSRMVAQLDPCSSDRAAAQQAVAAAADDLALATSRETQRTQREIEAAVALAFAEAEPAVDLYLDWYFSLAGEYARIWQHLFGDSAAYLAGRFEKTVLAEGRTQLAEELSAIESRSADRVQALASRHSHALRDVFEGNRCLAAAVPDSPPPPVGEGGPRHVYGAVSGSAAGLAAGLAVGARPIASRLIGRTALKRGVSAGGGAAAGAAVCSPTGPGAVLCGVLAGIGTWIAIDVLVLWGEEYLSRDGIRAEIMAAFDEAREELTAALTAANEARIAAAADEIRAIEAQLFSPLQEGLGRPRPS